MGGAGGSSPVPRQAGCPEASQDLCARWLGVQGAGSASRPPADVRGWAVHGAMAGYVEPQAGSTRKSV